MSISIVPSLSFGAPLQRSAHEALPAPRRVSSNPSAAPARAARSPERRAAARGAEPASSLLCRWSVVCDEAGAERLVARWLPQR